MLSLCCLCECSLLQATHDRRHAKCIIGEHLSVPKSCGIISTKEERDSTTKAQKKERRAQRTAEATTASNQPYQQQAPMPISDAIPIRGTLVYVGMSTNDPNRQSAELLVAQHFEAHMKAKKWKYQNKTSLTGICTCGQGRGTKQECGLVSFTFKRATEQAPAAWVCQRKLPFQCDHVCQKTKASGSTAYSAQQLSVVIQPNIARDQRCCHGELRTEIGKYCALEGPARAGAARAPDQHLPSSIITRAARAARQAVYGKQNVQAAKIPQVLAALEAHGWKTKLITEPAPVMKATLERIAREDWKYYQQDLPDDHPDKTKEFDPSQVPQVQEGADYVVGYFLAPPQARIAHEMCHRYGPLSMHAPMQIRTHAQLHLLVAGSHRQIWRIAPGPK